MSFLLYLMFSQEHSRKSLWKAVLLSMNSPSDLLYGKIHIQIDHLHFDFYIYCLSSDQSISNNLLYPLYSAQTYLRRTQRPSPTLFPHFPRQSNIFPIQPKLSPSRPSQTNNRSSSFRSPLYLPIFLLNCVNERRKVEKYYTEITIWVVADYEK